MTRGLSQYGHNGQTFFKLEQKIKQMVYVAFFNLNTTWQLRVIRP